MESKLERQLLLQLSGEVRALRYVLDIVMATHPLPHSLAQMWPEVLPELVDELVGSDPAPSAEVSEGWRKTLAHYSELIEALQGPPVSGEPL
jgi:hypothetical protein